MCKMGGDRKWGPADSTLTAPSTTQSKISDELNELGMLRT